MALALMPLPLLCMRPISAVVWCCCRAGCGKFVVVVVVEEEFEVAKTFGGRRGWVRKFRSGYQNSISSRLPSSSILDTPWSEVLTPTGHSIHGRHFTQCEDSLLEEEVAEDHSEASVRERVKGCMVHEKKARDTTSRHGANMM